ncbi:hypothetical protein, partial [Actinomadura sp. KC216]|uniref:hypothetical protein n=1 Tax=Actinomadura sp. KC216 TaxID=2530370 RepID=UPI001A9CDD21
GGPQCGVLGPGESCEIPVSASGGSVRWSASPGSPLTGGGSGIVPSGQTRRAVVTLSCGDESGSGSATVTFSPGGQTRSISWQCPGQGEGDGWN